MVKTTSDLRIFLVALWLGAALFFSFAVAPAAFGTLPQRELAGAIVNKTLAVVNYSGFIVGLILLISSFYAPQTAGGTKLSAERISAAVITVLCGFGQFVIGARLHNLRLQMGRPIDEIAVDDPLRIAFNDLHGYSVIILTVAMISAIILFFLLAARARNINNR